MAARRELWQAAFAPTKKATTLARGDGLLPVDAIVDISHARTRRRRQFAVRVGVPVLAVGLVILSIVGVSLYSYESNRASALVLSRSLLHGLQERIAGEVSHYLSPAAQAALIARDVVARHAVGDGKDALEGFAASMLGQVPHLQSFYAADGNGDFIMVSRDQSDGTITKLILNTPGQRQVSSVHLDKAGRVVDHTVAPGDNFDPRTRGWYKGALASTEVFWSEPYIFYTTHAPGISASIRLLQAGSIDRVFGVDITLAALSNFLGSLRIGKTGHAAIVERDGTVIAAAPLIAAAKSNRATATRTSTATLGDPALTAAFDRFRVHGYGNRTISVHARRFVTIAAPLPAAAQDWVLLIAAPEADFTAFAQANTRQHLLLSLITVALAACMGALLIRQNRRGDRLTQALREQRESGGRETQALSALAAQPGLFDPATHAPGLTEGLVEICAARRAGIWHLAGSGRTLSCADQFEPQRNDHVEGLQLSRSELPQFFEALDAGEPIEVADASADPRTAELYRLMMRPFGSRGVTVLPLRGSAGVAGALLLEDAQGAGHGQSFANAVAGVAALRFERRDAATSDAARSAQDWSAEDEREPAAEGVQPFSSLLTSNQAPSGIAARYFPAVATMIVRFDDATSLGRPDPTGIAAVADSLAQALQAVATRHQLPYMKLTGHHLVAAAGCIPNPDGTALFRLADAALAAREQCLSLLAQSDLDPVFRIGIDFGPALGAELGEQPRLFNLWGDSIRTAELMAQSAPEGGVIQVSEGAYDKLRQHFLFRARGLFYVPGAGTARTFILAGRR